GGAVDLGLADEEPRRVVEVRRLLDHLSTALDYMAPPGRRRQSARAAADAETRRSLSETFADGREEVEPAPVVADRDDEVDAFEVPLDGLRVRRAGRQRLLGEERHPALDEEPARGGSAIGWQADEHGIGVLRFEHLPEIGM